MAEKKVVGTRLSEAGVAWLDEMAEEFGVNRSVVMKVAFWVGRENEDRMRKVLREELE